MSTKKEFTVPTDGELVIEAGGSTKTLTLTRGTDVSITWVPDTEWAGI